MVLQAREVALIETDYPDLYRLYAYWRSLAPEGQLPLKKDLDPLELREWLDWLFLIEVTRNDQGALDFNFRLVGESINAIHHTRLKGKRPQDLNPPQFGRMLYRHYCETVERGEVLVHWVAGWEKSKAPEYYRILLPLGGEDGKIGYLLAADHHPPSLRQISERYFREAERTSQDSAKLLEFRCH
ncbi:MAG: PAS domain-containing protein [Pseudomonadota bacterium]